MSTPLAKGAHRGIAPANTSQLIGGLLQLLARAIGIQRTSLIAGKIFGCAG
ncbi:MAG TPA: hypothetical protein VLA84_23640 [Microcoleus sp.]|nr:hypothetical protein [Microcoleus sp.]